MLPKTAKIAGSIPAGTLLLMGLALLVTNIGGCQHFRSFMQAVSPPFLTPGGRTIAQPVEARIYPADLETGPPLDIEVIRVGHSIVLENRTVHAYPEAELWLNQEYGATIPLIRIGRNAPLALRSFLNRHTERYPTARFLQPELDQALVLAELVLEGRVHPLIVRLVDEEWRRP